ncbi:MAG: flagellar hook-length control protein FliK, partial [Eubacterium sp.]|nr:flagellar hook-length control protein FliK [Eubacterium sp.]
TQNMAGNAETQDHTRFDFQTNVHAQEPSVNVQAPQNPVAEAPLPQVNMQEVIDQIVQHTRIHLSEDVKSIEMQLNPENLGKVYLHVTEKQGTVTAQLTAQNENIKEALVQQAAILKENLNQQGIKVDAVEVTTGTHEFESNLERDAHSQEEQTRQQEEQNMRRSRRSINLGDLNDLDGLSGMMSEEEALVAQIMRDNGNNVDYKA